MHSYKVIKRDVIFNPVVTELSVEMNSSFAGMILPSYPKLLLNATFCSSPSEDNMKQLYPVSCP